MDELRGFYDPFADRANDYYNPGNLSDDEFVVAWQAAPTLKAVAEAAGVLKREASHRAAWLRRRGRELKLFRIGSSTTGTRQKLPEHR